MKGYILNTIPLSSLTGISKIQSKKLAKIGINTIQDLLLHFPLRYEDRTHLYAIGNLLPGIHATVEGTVINLNTVFNKKRMIMCQISDGSGILTIRFFNIKITAIKNILVTGRRILVHGKAKNSKYGIEMIHPEYYVQDNINMSFLQKTLTPVYPTTKGINQNTLRKLTDQALVMLKTHSINELLPYKVSKSMISLQEALFVIHRPPVTIQLAELQKEQHPAQQRLIFEKLIAHNLYVLSLRTNIQRFHAHQVPICNILKKKMLNLLPFKLTNAQLRVVEEIEHDMTLDIPMIRLVQGDVGSGKTLVAALAALCPISHKKQVAIMVPTELLAAQYVNTISKWFTPLGIKVGWLFGKQRRKIRLEQQEAIASGQVQMIIGTHAILQKQVKFNNLALVIIDEQHRFGVHQRLMLREKGLQQGFYPHQLIMTATPIPRTLAMTTYSYMDTSIIDELPPGRSPVTTVVIPDSRRNDIINRIRNFYSNGNHQAYWVCTLIEESDILKAQAAEKIKKELQLALPNVKIGLIHGRMKATEKQEIMHSFKLGKLQLLVSTTVIEVGIDAPNANLMIIENPERLGLAQLHQLRGRIGRGTIASHCVLLYKSPLTKSAQRRLQTLRNSNDGFVIAQNDLDIRGPGELFGTRQTGNSEFRMINVLHNPILILKTQHIAHHMHVFYPEQAAALIARWISITNFYSNLNI